MPKEGNFAAKGDEFEVIVNGDGAVLAPKSVVEKADLACEMEPEKPLGVKPNGEAAAKLSKAEV